MPARPAVALAVAALTVAACGTTPRDAVRDKVEQFAQATRSHDYRTLCTQVIAPSLLVRLKAAGVTCEQAMAIGLGSVRDPTLSIGQITVRGSSATVIVLTLAANQPSALDALQLVDTKAGWRITSLRAPVAGVTR